MVPPSPTITSCQVGCPIRRSWDQGLFSAPPSLSQSITSFIASCCQGIHQTPFSRLIRSRRRQALLREARFKGLNPSRSSGRKSLTRAPPLGRGSAPVGGPYGPCGPDKPHGQFLDLERLSPASRVDPPKGTRRSPPARHRSRPPPTREGPGNVSCICSLHDVKYPIRRSDTKTRPGARLGIRYPIRQRMSQGHHRAGHTRDAPPKGCEASPNPARPDLVEPIGIEPMTF